MSAETLSINNIVKRIDVSMTVLNALLAEVMELVDENHDGVMTEQSYISLLDALKREWDDWNGGNCSKEVYLEELRRDDPTVAFKTDLNIKRCIKTWTGVRNSIKMCIKQEGDLTTTITESENDVWEFKIDIDYDVREKWVRNADETFHQPHLTGWLGKKAVDIDY